MGFIDASEMFDTYGESLHSIRGFVRDAYDSNGVRFNTGNSLYDKDDLLHLSYSDFIQEIIPKLTEHDTIIFGIITDPDTNPDMDNEYELTKTISKSCKEKKKLLLINLSRKK